MTTIQDIADKLGISKSTVSKALNDAPDVSKALRKQVLETAVALDYTKLRRYKKPVKKICILIEKENIEYEKPQHFAYDIIIGFRQLAEPAGFEVETVAVDTAFQKNTAYDIFMLEHDYVGSFVLGFSLNDPWLKDFDNSKTPTALFDNHITGNLSTAYVGVDNDEGMELILSHLTSLGHRKIAYLGGSLGSYILKVRHSAFVHAMHHHGLITDSDNIGCSYYISECIEKYLPKFLESGITAVICSHDDVACAAIKKCMQLGYKVPEDISIVGFDDLPIATSTSPKLTTVRQDRVELGKSGFFALSSLLSDIPISTFLLHTKLIIRESTSSVRTKKSNNL